MLPNWIPWRGFSSSYEKPVSLELQVMTTFFKISWRRTTFKHRPKPVCLTGKVHAARLLHLSWEQVHLAALARLQDIAGNWGLRNVTTRSLLNDLPGSLRTGERRQRPGHGNAINRSAPKGFSTYSHLIEFVCVLIPWEGNLSDTMSTMNTTTQQFVKERTSPIKSHPRDPGFWLIKAKWG